LQDGSSKADNAVSLQIRFQERVITTPKMTGENLDFRQDNHKRRKRPVATLGKRGPGYLAFGLENWARASRMPESDRIWTTLYLGSF